VTYGENS